MFLMNDNEVYFDLNDKRVIIHGGIVIQYAGGR